MNKAYLMLSILIVLAGCKKNDKENTSSHSESTKINVETTAVQSFVGNLTLQYSGLIEAAETTPLSFKTAGTVIQILVEEGQFVKKKQLLAKLDNTNSISTYELVLQKKQQAQDAYSRMKPMKENGTLSDIKWVEVETGLSQATIATEIAKRSIDDNNLYAPKSGVIGKKNVLQGMNVLPAVTSFELLNINNVYVNIPVPENEVGQLRIGQQAEIKIAATSQTLTGKINRIGVVANTISHTYPVKILVKNKDWKIKPGMVCNATLNTQKNYNGLMLSSKALQLNANGEQYIYLVQDNGVIIKEVLVESLSNNKVIVKGLTEGDIVVISGQEKLRDGSLINIINKK